MKIVASCIEPAIPSIYDDSGNDEEWKAAVEIFNNSWHGVALTTVLNRHVAQSKQSA